MVARRKERPQPAGGVLDLDGAEYFLRADVHAGGRRARPPYRRILRPQAFNGALQRRVSSVLVTRTQVQPVSLQTRSSPAPGAP